MDSNVKALTCQTSNFDPGKQLLRRMAHRTDAIRENTAKTAPEYERSPQRPFYLFFDSTALALLLVAALGTLSEGLSSLQLGPNVDWAITSSTANSRRGVQHTFLAPPLSPWARAAEAGKHQPPVQDGAGSSSLSAKKGLRAPD